MDRLAAMETFAQVATSGSFTRAAQAMQLPPTTVSLRVAQLEDHLGVRLLTRTTRRLSLTADGAAYLEQVRRLLKDVQEVEEGVRGETRNPRGRLRVDVPAATGRHVLAPALPQFHARYPGIVVEVGSSDRPVDMIAEGIDCVIRGGELHEEHVIARALGAFEVVTCAAPAYLARHGTPRCLADLGSHSAVNFFSARSGKVFAFEFVDDGAPLAIDMPHRAAANDADTHIALTVAGLGLAQSPRTRHVDALIRGGQLVVVLPQWSCGSLPLHVMYPRNRHLSARVRVFVDWVTALYGELFGQLKGSRAGARPRRSG